MCARGPVQRDFDFCIIVNPRNPLRAQIEVFVQIFFTFYFCKFTLKDDLANFEPVPKTYR